jgi:hypothetical protein
MTTISTLEQSTTHSPASQPASQTDRQTDRQTEKLLLTNTTVNNYSD